MGKRLREAHVLGATIRLKIRWPDFTTMTRQVSLKQATDQDQVIYSNGVVLFKRVYHAGQSVRLIGLGVSGIGPAIRQLNLWDQLPDLDASVPTERGIRLQTALDHIRERYGHNSVQRGIAHSTKETEN